MDSSRDGYGTGTGGGGQLRRAVGVVTDYVFPAPKYSQFDTQQQYLKKPAQDYVTNLPLQMLLYFNIFYFPLWLTAEILMLVTKFYALDVIYKIIIIAILITMTVVEIIRLYIAYVGNLMEKVPELAGFWMLTLLIELPLVLFLLLNEATIITPLERAVTIIMTAFYLLEIIIGYFAIRAMVNYQVTKFHQQQFSNLEQIQNPYGTQAAGGQGGQGTPRPSTLRETRRRDSLHKLGSHGLLGNELPLEFQGMSSYLLPKLSSPKSS